MESTPYINKNKFKARAMLIGDRIDLRTLETADRLAVSPLTFQVNGGGIAVLFRYGAVVLFDVSPMDQATFINQMKPMIHQPYTEAEIEYVDVVINPNAREGIEGNTVYLKDTAVERLQLVADILGKSVALSLHETKLAQSFDKIEPFAAKLEHRSRVGRHANELLKYIGGALLTEHKMISRVEVTDKPEILWERPELERLYLRLEDEYEIRERHMVFKRKLELISRTAYTVLEMLQNRRSLRVEWYIVILIVMEIMLTLYEMFIRSH